MAGDKKTGFWQTVKGKLMKGEVKISPGLRGKSLEHFSIDGFLDIASEPPPQSMMDIYDETVRKNISRSTSIDKSFLRPAPPNPDADAVNARHYADMLRDQATQGRGLGTSQFRQQIRDLQRQANIRAMEMGTDRNYPVFREEYQATWDPPVIDDPIGRLPKVEKANVPTDHDPEEFLNGNYPKTHDDMEDDYAVYVVRGKFKENELAWNLDVEGKTVWLPKSRCVYKPHDQEIAIPDRIASDRGLEC